jgi:hypothetical protein
LMLFLIIVWTVISQFRWYRTFKDRMTNVILRRKSCQATHNKKGANEE